MELAAVFEPVSKEMELVETELERIAQRVGGNGLGARGRNGILGRIVRHPFMVPGKRIRPALVLLSSRVIRQNGDPRPIIGLAAAVELLHAASLVHDDIIDGAETRRHQVSLNRLFGNRVAVLAGDILYTHFFSLITGLAAVGVERRLSILEHFLETTKAMCMGEILAQEAAARGKAPLGFEEYLEISMDKTAVLFSACCRTAAIVSGAEQRIVDALSGFGLSFGLVFQMVDDLMDGDHLLDPRVDLGEKARERAAQARAQADTLPAGPYREKLHDLVDFVIGQPIS